MFGLYGVEQVSVLTADLRALTVSTKAVPKHEPLVQSVWTASDAAKDAVRLKLPAAAGVYVTAQELLPLAGVHELEVEAPFTSSVKVPAGVVAPAPDVSLTLSVQLVGALIGTVAGLQTETRVEVGLLVTLRLVPPLVDDWCPTSPL
jgi:hypothetical protein